MKAIFKNTEGDYLQAEIKVSNKSLFVMDEFGGDRLKDGDQVSLDLMNSFSDDLQWEQVFSANPNKEKKLEHIDGWKYFVFGEITSINPMICDCGLLELEGPFETNDTRCIGEFIGFRVSRLTAFGT